MTFVDALLIALLLGAAWSGFRRGLINSAFALVGAVVGAILGIQLAPLLIGRIDQAAAKIAVAMAVVVLGVGLGELGGSGLGRWLSSRVTWRPARVVDHGLGLLGNVAAVMIVAWMIAVPLASVPYPALASAIRSSKLLAAADKIMPSGVRDISDRMRDLLDDSGFPAILDPLTPTPDTDVAAPDQALADSPTLSVAGRSVLKVIGSAPSCSRRIEGSAFVIGPNRMLTNAHVVAGTDQVMVEQNGVSLPATVVEYDSERDLAVLAVGKLTEPALKFSDSTASTGDSAAAAGYPLDGPFELTPARVESSFTLRGPDIYAGSTVSRQVYTVSAAIHPGNSGGPLLEPDGSVLGVVFAAAIDKPDVGFALTDAEIAPVVAAGLTASTAVGTGTCVPD